MAQDPELQRLLDREAIRDLVHRYAHYVWQKDMQRMIDLFHDDGRMAVDAQPPLCGRKALLEFYGQMRNDSEFLPFVHNHVIDLEGDRATGTCYIDLRATIGGRSMIGSGYYDDVYVRSAPGTESWRFASRHLHMKYLVPITQGWAEAQRDPSKR